MGIETPQPDHPLRRRGQCRPPYRKRENIENERAQGYIHILDEKSERLKQLIEDLVEASKVSSGNVKLDMQTIDLVELVYQTAGEFDEKFERKGLTIVTKLPSSLRVRRTSRYVDAQVSPPPPASPDSVTHISPSGQYIPFYTADGLPTSLKNGTCLDILNRWRYTISKQ